MNPPAHWLTKLTELRPALGKDGPAPHKPLLLLAVIDLVETRCLTGTVLDRTPELTFRFLAYWRVVAARRSQKPDLRMPFHHLSTQEFWFPQTAEGRRSESRNTTARVVLDESFRELLNDPTYRERARHLLITRYFNKAEQFGLFAAVGMPVPSDEAIAELDENVASRTAVQRGREARFRLIVVAAYNYTCALTHYRLTTVEAGTLVDAAHIHQFSKSRNNDPKNGLALSKNAHWLFDNGLWTIRNDYTVEVAEGHFSEDHPQGLGLLSYRDQKLFLPTDPNLRPELTYLSWHRKNKFRRRK